MDVDIDVTKMVKRCRKLELRFYPAMIYAVMRAVNDNEAFRMAVDENGDLGYYDVCHPSYTIFHKDDKTFSDIWTAYDEDFSRFYSAAVKDMEDYKDVKGIKAKQGRPDAFYTGVLYSMGNIFLALAMIRQVREEWYFPVITFGKYKKSDKKRMLPFSVFVNHAVADGYHTSKLVNDVQRYCKTCKAWMK